ncbi:cytokine inducible SH2-containing protein b isoform X3 [Cottoperca gobio]|uniref:Cytokine-inducible SH2-containing protein n=1 Tax=Cottoperca gobio TaxID=56716 RepID=A0A6J2PQ04_COTGO|nr:cytokine-inducible SH2-containing protein-like isoform X3 [Cottoperca gobio]
MESTICRAASEMVARAVTIFHHEERHGSCHPHPSPPPCDPAEDLCCITNTFQYLHNSGWYWGSISASEAREALLKRSEGTFLVRDSSHPQCMLALSVKTRCGPTSVRIKYSMGSFWLDSISPVLPHLQSFPDVLSLIQHYTASGHTPQGQKSNDIHPQTKPDPAKHTDKDSGVPLKLMHPLHKPEAFPSLQHLTRLTVNRHTKCPDQLPLPKPLLHYLQDYPFHI